MLQTKVKASSITNLTDARYFAAKEVEWVGFSLDPGSEHFIEPTKIAAIKEWLDGVAFVGEFGIQTPVDVHRIQDMLQLDVLQLSHFTPVEVIGKMPDIPKIKEVVVEADQDAGQLQAHLEAYGAAVDYFLLDFSRNGYTWDRLLENRSFQVDHLQLLCKSFPVMLELDWTAVGLRKALQSLDLAGVSLKGGEEEKVGYKSFDEIDDLFDILEEAAI